MANYTLNLPDIFTTLYPNGVEPMFLEEFPSFGIFQKKANYLTEGGRQLNWQLDSGSGDATTIAEAEANEGPSTHKRPQITRVREYMSETIEREAMLAARNDKDRIIDLVNLGVKNAVRKGKRSWSIHMFRDGTGVRARLAAAASGVGTATVTLANANDAKLFESGDWLQATADKSTLRSAGAKIKVTGRSIGAGTLTAGGNWTASIAAITDGDYLIRSGDLNNVVTGLAAWIPPTAPGATAFFGVDRSTLGEGAYGHRPSIASSNLLSIGIDAAGYMYDVGAGSPDIWIVNGIDFASICKDLTSIEQIVVPATGSNGKKADIGYEAVNIRGPNGKITMLPDPLCPRGQSWMGMREEVQWWLLGGSLVEQITLGMGDSNGFVVAGVDGVKFRFGGYGQFVVTRPWDWAYVALPTG
jgi:hypothetical protein